MRGYSVIGVAIHVIRKKMIVLANTCDEEHSCKQEQTIYLQTHVDHTCFMFQVQTFSNSYAL